MKNKRKICILTQPLHINYGGLLQAFALQKVLRDLGHDIVTDERPRRELPLYRKILSICKRLVYKFILLRRVDCLSPYFESLSDYAVISQNTDDFIRKNILTTDFFAGRSKPKKESVDKFDTFIVGSDQVWRPEYFYNSNYFFKFLGDRKDIRRIAYAASFGVEDWCFKGEIEEEAQFYAPLINAVSVREDSAIALCKTKLGVDAQQVLDPTLLLDKSVYVDLIEKDHIPASSGNMMTYILDETQVKQAIIHKVANGLNLIPFKVMPELKLNKDNRKQIERCIYPKVTEWLRGFMDAEFIVTDSFHGTVFSIIFNKPFIAIANKDRGVTRFTSLLKIFGLEERLIYSLNELTDDLINESIDFNQVNAIREKEMINSIAFLINALK